MNDTYQVYLSLGSNIQPEINLLKAIELLRGLGEVAATSSAWESAAIGSRGPNFLNACVLFLTTNHPDQLREKITLPLETALGRVRSEDKYAPRTIDIDIMMLDGKPTNLERWNYAYVVLPMSELMPDFKHPLTHKRLAVVAQNLRKQIQIERRPNVLVKQA